MKCRYKQKAAEIKKEAQRQRTMEVYSEIIDMFMDFTDYYTGSILHSEHGFGKQRLNEFYADSTNMLKGMMDRYESEDDPVDDYAMNTYWALKMRLEAIDVDVEALSEAIPLTDNYQKSYSRDPAHEQRLRFVTDMEVYIREDIAATLWYMHEHRGYGKIRLERMFTQIWKAYREFCSWYLMVRDGYDTKLRYMIWSLRHELKEIGVDFLNQPEEEETWMNAPSWDIALSRIASTN